MYEAYVEKVKKEIERLLAEGKEYWYDFDISRVQMLLIMNHLSAVYHIEVKPCRSCIGDKKYDVTIQIR